MCCARYKSDERGVIFGLLFTHPVIPHRKMFLLILCLILLTQIVFSETNSKAQEFLTEFNRRALLERNKFEIASWKYSSDLSSTEAKEGKKSATLAFEAFLEEARKNASKFSNMDDLSEDLQRQIKLIRVSGTLHDQQKRKKLTDIKIQMQTIYSASQVYDPLTRKNLSLSPDLTNIMANPSSTFDKLYFAWKGWRDTVGPKIRPLYEEYVKLANEGAKDNNFEDYGAYWRAPYEVDNLPELVKILWKDLEPLYQELHAYVRFHIAKKYPQVKDKEAIPAHLLGNMWSQNWVEIYPLVEPYDNRTSLDVTVTMREKNYSIEDIFRVTESFFVSLGMENLPKKFLQMSMIRKPKGRKVGCHPSASDMYLKTEDGEKDVRIHQCTEVTQDWLVTTHHEMGHVYYFMLFWDQPYIFRDSANPGFHEAVGDTMSLSVSTPQHLAKIGLLNDFKPDEGMKINSLMKLALDYVAFLPFGYLIDQWRWSVFQGKIKPDKYNTEWWRLRTRYQGIKPPLSRTENDFDPGVKFHVPYDVSYIRYFISRVLQFQFHKAACKAAGFEGPLHQCSIYKSTAAGKKIGEMLKLGRSKPWPEALEKLTDKQSMDVGPMKEYFWPLYLWLRKQRCSSNYTIGWPENPASLDDPCVVPTTLPDNDSNKTPPNKKPRGKAHSQSLNTAGKMVIAVSSLLLSVRVIGLGI